MKPLTPHRSATRSERREGDIIHSTTCNRIELPQLTRLNTERKLSMYAMPTEHRRSDLHRTYRPAQRFYVPNVHRDVEEILCDTGYSARVLYKLRQLSVLAGWVARRRCACGRVRGSRVSIQVWIRACEFFRAQRVVSERDQGRYRPYSHQGERYRMV